ncbi:hypothetical protein DNL40_07580 [Xylanimonas oleitrophica]|uniref:Uncharacterized protein n=1 Tax=Xylanimonas oleitrophica TaxID=2607479 RepID=A0A2W5WQE0_9MICO|nr:hypothetical protein [Xylanimonas oleitrophica]PZR53370.1 hypothetical protein DNL40_07580 [Xylanimonas oleitrophica]
MTTYTIRPAVAGELGPGTILDASVHPPRVKRLNYEFSDWFGDDLVTTFPCYVVTERLVHALRERGITGVEFDHVEVTRSPDFAELHTGQLPNFRWMKVTGRPGVDDLWIGENHRLCATESGLEALRTGQLDNALVEAVRD